MMKPTTGRVVWLIDPHLSDQPLAAMVAYVHDERRINVGYLTAQGEHRSMVNVPLLQDGDDPTVLGPGPFATWMPYQIGQAKRHEATVAGFNPLPGRMSTPERGRRHGDAEALRELSMERGDQLRIDPKKS